MTKRDRVRAAAAAGKAVEGAAVAANPANPATVTALAVTGTPAPMTMAELLAELYPNGGPKRVAGGMAIALQRELRRRNRKAEKGY